MKNKVPYKDFKFAMSSDNHIMDQLQFFLSRNSTRTRIKGDNNSQNSPSVIHQSRIRRRVTLNIESNTSSISD